MTRAVDFISSKAGYFFLLILLIFNTACAEWLDKLSVKEKPPFSCPHKCGEWGSPSIRALEWDFVQILYEADWISEWIQDNNQRAFEGEKPLSSFRWPKLINFDSKWYTRVINSPDGNHISMMEKFKAGEECLRKYKGEYLTELQARKILHQAGFKSFPRPKGIPENYLVKITDRGTGMEYMHPTNTHISVRIMHGKPHSPNPSQQKPYVVQKKDGKAFDKHGNLVDQNTPAAHIPLEEFIYRE